MNKELIKRQLTFLGFVVGTITLFVFNDWAIDEVMNGLEYDYYIPLSLTILQVWLVTKYLHK